MRSIHEGRWAEHTSLSNAVRITSMNLRGLLSAHGGKETCSILYPYTLVPKSYSFTFIRNDGSEYHSGVNSFTSVSDVREHISHV